MCAFSALTLLVGRQEGHLPVKNWVVGCWHGYLSWARCRLAYGPADATATHCLFSKIQIGFIFLVPAHLCSPGKGPLNGCVCVCVCYVIWLTQCWWLLGCRPYYVDVIVTISVLITFACCWLVYHSHHSARSQTERLTKDLAALQSAEDSLRSLQKQ